MELRHLRYFAAVARTLSFREASEDLHLSTPALSKQIKDLEEELGVRLMERNTSGVRLTNAGTVFLAEARDILARAKRATELAREAAKGHRGRLSIGNIGPITANLIATRLATFCSRYPDIEIDLIDMDVASQISALERGEIHVGFIAAAAVAQLPRDVIHVPLLTTPLFAALGSDHRLAALTTIPLAELAKERLLCVGSGKQSLHRVYIRNLLEGRGLKAQTLIDVKGFESLLAMIAGGQGVSLLAGRTGLTRIDNVVIRPLKETGTDVEIAISAVWRENERASLARTFIEELQETAPIAKKARTRTQRSAA
ncbi:MAG TPA: LysR substrate-binding domain-containing protein [Opitutaceae bacterium]|nr:LysR substrate-binding domain-containing protein [Opitutaceae bacterium]